MSRSSNISSPLKRGRPRKVAAASTTTAVASLQVPSTSTLTVIVKNRFQHTRAVYTANGTPNKRQKTTLEVLSDNYQDNESSSDVSSTCTSHTTTSLSTVSRTTAAAAATHPAIAPEQPSISICPGCKSTETLHIGNNFFKCRKCSRNYMPLPQLRGNAQPGSVTTTILPVTAFYGNESASNMVAKSTTASITGQSQIANAQRSMIATLTSATTRKKKQLETIDLISSDEDEDNQSPSPSLPPVNSTVSEKMRLPGSQTGSVTAADTSTAQSSSKSEAAPSLSPYVFHCNKVMFGELYGHSMSPTKVQDSRMYLSLECAIVRQNVQATEKYTLSVGSNDVEKILIHFGKIPSFIAIETAEKFASVACNRIGRKVLCPNSEVVKKRYIVLALNSAFKNENEACAERNNFIEAVSPWAHVEIISHVDAIQLIETINLNVCQRELSYGKILEAFGPVETLLIFPPSSGGIPITNLDVACLDEGTYLNDIIIDFYLKYVWENVMTSEQREKTYVFNSYFYKRLTQKTSPKASPASMHAQVKKWTRNVDIFKKDFIIIPVNEHSHWYLVAVCFPGLMNDSKVEELNEQEDEEEDDDSTTDFIMKDANDEVTSNDCKPSLQSGVPQLSSNQPSLLHQSLQVQDNAMDISIDQKTDISSSNHNTDSNSSTNHSTDVNSSTNHSTDVNSSTNHDTNEKSPTNPSNEEQTSDGKSSTAPPAVVEKPSFKQATDLEPLNRPCILIFDSLMGSGHGKVFTNLRHYLTQEWNSRKAHDHALRTFDKETMKGCYPKVPRQNNDCDCGVFLLQYAEFFFTKPVKHLRMPVHLEEWFTVDSVTKKRDEIKSLIHKLAKDHKTDVETNTSNKNKQ